MLTSGYPFYETRTALPAIEKRSAETHVPEAEPSFESSNDATCAGRILGPEDRNPRRRQRPREEKPTREENVQRIRRECSTGVEQVEVACQVVMPGAKVAIESQPDLLEPCPLPPVLNLPPWARLRVRAQPL